MLKQMQFFICAFHICCFIISFGNDSDFDDDSKQAFEALILSGWIRLCMLVGAVLFFCVVRLCDVWYASCWFGRNCAVSLCIYI